MPVPARSDAEVPVTVGVDTHLDPVVGPRAPGVEVIQHLPQGLDLVRKKQLSGDRQGDQGGRVGRGGGTEHGRNLGNG
ncbi:MAG: hypothetical protein H0V28_02120 [Rubrobacteraceae bacterium]|nr:hypothetical protein [Rubrobacteraceae bacterium]